MRAQTTRWAQWHADGTSAAPFVLPLDRSGKTTHLANCLNTVISEDGGTDLQRVSQHTKQRGEALTRAHTLKEAAHKLRSWRWVLSLSSWTRTSIVIWSNVLVRVLDFCSRQRRTHWVNNRLWFLARTVRSVWLFSLTFFAWQSRPASRRFWLIVNELS